MQTVTAGCVGRVSRGTGIEQASRHWRPCRVSKMKSRGFEQACKRDTMTYDNRTEEIQPSRGTTYKVQVCETGGSSEHGAERVCSYGGCPHEGNGPERRYRGAYNRHPIQE